MVPHAAGGQLSREHLVRMPLSEQVWPLMQESVSVTQAVCARACTDAGI